MAFDPRYTWLQPIEIDNTPEGGATAFTQLTDAPATITPKAIMCGNPDGSGLSFKGQITADDTGVVITQSNPDPDDWGASFTAAGAQGGGRAFIYAGDQPDYSYAEVNAKVNGNKARLRTTDTLASTQVVFGNDTVEAKSSEADGASLTFTHYNPAGSKTLQIAVKDDGVSMVMDSSVPFSMSGFDVNAFDGAARLTVNSSQYGITKAIQVKIGGAVYYLPLFGPAA